MLLVGHRGAKALEPENTLKSFRKAIQLKVNAIEFDTHITKDKVPIVIHDHTLERTTNGKGAVHEKTLKELKKLNAGKGEKIPTVKETLMLLKKHKITALVELKDKKHVKEIIKVIKKTGMTNKTIVLSFSTDSLKEAKKLAPNIQTALVFKNKIKNVQGFMKLGKAIKIDWYFGSKDALTKKLVDTMHKWKYKIEAWVCNTKKDVTKFKKMGVDGIASDKPNLLH